MKNFIALSVILLATLPLDAFAKWQLVKENSSIHFSSTKKEHVVEHHQFRAFESNVNADGKLAFTIDLSSVDTGIAIRDTRMKEFLFDVEKYTQAQFTSAQSMKSLLKDMQVGQIKRGTLQGELSLHGQVKTIAIDYILTPLSENSFTVVSTAPVLVKASDFELVDGIKKLQELAGLTSIGQTVPVSFALHFRAHSD